MIIENAMVLSYQDGIAQVQCYAKQACGGCAAQKNCGSKALSGLAGEKLAQVLEIKANEDLRAGEMIQLGIPETTLLKSVFWVYCIPLMILILSALVLSQFIINELWVAFGMIFSTACSFFMVKKIIAHQQLTELTPIFLGKVRENRLGE